MEMGLEQKMRGWVSVLGLGDIEKGFHVGAGFRERERERERGVLVC